MSWSLSVQHHLPIPGGPVLIPGSVPSLGLLATVLEDSFSVILQRILIRQHGYLGSPVQCNFFWHRARNEPAHTHTGTHIAAPGLAKSNTST